MNWLKLGIIAALIAGLYFGWQSVKSSIWNDGYAAQKAEIDKLTAIANETARELERMNRISKEKALENRTKELMANVAAADRARAAAISLQNDSSASLQTARADHSACLVSASTHAELLDQCRARYSELAGKAQGHVTDIKALIESWPK